MLGMSIKARILIVCHCERKSGNMIIISARKATPTERKHY
ncbi:MAG: BrnT family toxin [Proteobacteria bacterium]|nr:BrnT family toxin [Pseudomonadota bacterium]MCH8057397.1 BrnT family toxin [Pseudomonadota bacterium]